MLRTTDSKLRSPNLAAMRGAVAAVTLAMTAPAQLQFDVLSGTGLGSDPNSVSAFALGDIDGDGDLDVLSADWGQNRLYRNDGAGRFVDVTATRLPVHGATTRAVAFGDVDGDGDLDLLSGNGLPGPGNGQQDRLYRNDGGTFVDVTATQLPTQSTSTGSLALGDVDGDGDLDAVFGDYVGLRLYRNDGTGNFADVTTAQMPGIGFGGDVGLGDLDGDGDLDVVCGSNVVLRNDGAGAFTDVTTTSMPRTTYDSWLGALGDADGDGDLDVFSLRLGISPGAPNRVELFQNDGSGVFQDVTTASMPAHGAGARYVLPGDVDEDGDLDLVLLGFWVPRGSGGAGAYSTELLLLNDGQGRFVDASARLSVGPSGGGGPGVLGDLDGDGDLDLIDAMASQAHGRVAVNLLRQLHAPLPLRQGQAYTLDAYQRYGQIGLVDVALPWAALGAASIPVPGFGTLGIDPASMVALPGIPIDPATGSGSFTFTVPNDPALVGTPLFTQALHVAWPTAARLGNVVADVVH